MYVLKYKFSVFLAKEHTFLFSFRQDKPQKRRTQKMKRLLLLPITLLLAASTIWCLDSDANVKRNDIKSPDVSSLSDMKKRDFVALKKKYKRRRRGWNVGAMNYEKRSEGSNQVQSPVQQNLAQLSGITSDGCTLLLRCPDNGPEE